MQFAASTLLLAGATFLTTASAGNMFAISGTGVPGHLVTLSVANGRIGDAPTCHGSSTIGPLPADGTIQCKDGYSLTFHWESVEQGHFSATYATPGSAPFTYNLPINGNDGTTFQVGFSNYFEEKRAENAFNA